MLVLNTLKKVLMLLNHSPPFIQQVGHHAHKGLGLDLAPLLQFIQVQSKFKPLGSIQKTYHSYAASNQLMNCSQAWSCSDVKSSFLVNVTKRKTQRFKHAHCLNVGGQTSQSDVQPLSHREDLLEVCGDHLSLDAESPVGCDGHTVLPPHGHHGPSVIGHNRLQELKEIIQFSHYR